MVRVHFVAYEGNNQVTFEVIDDTEQSAKEQGFAWAKASGFRGVRCYLVTPHLPKGIVNVKRTLIVSGSENI